jgi:hypothetical protein
MVLEEFKKHPVDYIFLFLGLLVVAFLFVTNANNPEKQMLFVWFGSGYYFFWGIFHHTIKGEIHTKIVIEYLLISLVVIGAAKLVLSHI